MWAGLGYYRRARYLLEVCSLAPHLDSVIPTSFWLEESNQFSKSIYMSLFCYTFHYDHSLSFVISNMT